MYRPAGLLPGPLPARCWSSYNWAVAQVAFRRLRPDAVLPRYMSDGAAGMDLAASLDEPVLLGPGERHAVGTGLAVEIPIGFEGQLRARSGLALRSGVALANGIGTIDSDYRGEIKVILVNLGSQPVTFRTGDRIAQLVIAPVTRCQVVEASAISSTARGSGGFGSTGLAS